MRTDKGIALVYVLVMTVVMAVIAGGILSFTTQQFQLVNRQEQAAVAKKADEQALARFITAMNNGTPCATNIPGYNYTFMFCPMGGGYDSCCRYTAIGAARIWVSCVSVPLRCDLSFDSPLP